jgi:hypothetical protein
MSIAGHSRKPAVNDPEHGFPPLSQGRPPVDRPVRTDAADRAIDTRPAAASRQLFRSIPKYSVQDVLEHFERASNIANGRHGKAQGADMTSESDARMERWQNTRAARLAALPWLHTDTSGPRTVRYLKDEL